MDEASGVLWRGTGGNIDHQVWMLGLVFHSMIETPRALEAGGGEGGTAALCVFAARKMLWFGLLSRVDLVL